MTVLLSLAFLLTIFYPLSLRGTTKSQEYLLRELESIKNVFELKYAPLLFRNSSLLWNLEKEVQAARNEVLENPQLPPREARRILKKFFRRVGDFHVDIYFHSSEASLLPFKISGAEGRYFVSVINPKASNYQTIPVNIGDEILRFDGKSIADAVRDFQIVEMYDTHDRTEPGLAEAFFTQRQGMHAHRMPRGEVEIEVFHRTTGKRQTYLARWEYHPELISYPEPMVPKSLRSGTKIGEHPYYMIEMGSPLFAAQELLERKYPSLAEEFPDNDNGLYASSSFRPLGSMATEFGAAIEGASQVQIVHRGNSKFFKTYVYKTPEGRKIGYIRFPHFWCNHVEALDLLSIISSFQTNTEALVIDQTTNPGGWFYFMFCVASLLTDKPLQTHLHHQTISHGDAAYAAKTLRELREIKNSADAKKKMGLTIQGLNVDFEMVKENIKHYEFILDQWNQGKYLTAPAPLMGMAEIRPHPKVRYTKPIAMLVNSLSISCADFLPAMLQDNKRAIIVGTRTAGAGGIVHRFCPVSRFGISSYTTTGSYAWRPDGSPLEKNGVAPDVEYIVTAEDMTNGFQGLFQAVHEALEPLLGPKDPGSVSEREQPQPQPQPQRQRPRRKRDRTPAQPS